MLLVQNAGSTVSNHGTLERNTLERNTAYTVFFALFGFAAFNNNSSVLNASIKLDRAVF